MKQTTVGVFERPQDAERAVNRAHADLNIPSDDISFLYRDDAGELKEVDPVAISNDATARGTASRFWIGAILGFLAGLAEVVDAISVTNLFAPYSTQLIERGTALGFTETTVVLTIFTIAGALIGLIVGSLISVTARGSRMSTLVASARPREILVAVNAPASRDVYSLFKTLGAIDTRVYRLSI